MDQSKQNAVKIINFIKKKAQALSFQVKQAKQEAPEHTEICIVEQ